MVLNMSIGHDQPFKCPANLLLSLKFFRSPFSDTVFVRDILTCQSHILISVDMLFFDADTHFSIAANRSLSQSVSQ